MADILQAIQNRRSIYGIGGKNPVGDEAVEHMLGMIIKDMPTAYNSQSTRMVLLLGKDHSRLWEIVHDTLKTVVPPDKFPRTADKLAGFAAGHGTILYFDDTEVTEKLQKDMPAFAEQFATWAQQQNGMLQYAVWASLEDKGLGASLQHYNPLIDDAVQREWGLPKNWQLFAQMPFGNVTEMPETKDKMPLEQRFKVFGR